MNKKENVFYLLIGTVALIVCWIYNIQHINQGGTFASFIDQNFVNPASASIFYDISFLFLSCSIWIYFEAKRIKIKHW